MRFKSILVLIGFLSYGWMSHGQGRSLNFISTQSIDVSLFPAPPSDQSPEGLKDLEDVYQLQITRTQERCQQAAKDITLSMGVLYGPPMGPLTREEVRGIQNLSRLVFADADYYVNRVKSRWRRLRPFERSRRIVPCIPPHASSSYPSGHATISRAFALVLAEIYPEKREALLERSNVVAMSRVVGGVHHPIDIQAGQYLAGLIVDQMKQNRNFQATLAPLRTRER